MLTVMRVIAVACIPLGGISFGLPDVVACFGADGGFAIEAGVEGGCFCEPGDHDGPSEAVGPAILAANAGGGTDCVCLPFSSEWQATVARLKQDHYPKEFVQQPSTPIALRHQKPTLVVRMVPNGEIRSPDPFFRLALRTIVLLT